MHNFKSLDQMFFRAGFDKSRHNLVKQNGRSCHNRLEGFCELGPVSGPKVYILGDSVVASAMPEIVTALPDSLIIQITNGACYFSPNTVKKNKKGILKHRCTRSYQNSTKSRLINEDSKSLVIVGGQLNNYLGNEKRFEIDGGGPITTAHLMDNFYELSKNPNLSFIFLTPTPQYNRASYDAAVSQTLSRSLNELKGFSFSETLLSQKDNIAGTEVFFNSVITSGLGIVVRTEEAYCDDELCYAARDGVPFVVDQHYLSEGGGKIYADLIRGAVESRQ